MKNAYVMVSLRYPKDPAVKAAAESFISGMKLMHDLIGEGSWFKVIQIAHPEMAVQITRTLKDPDQQESEAKRVIFQMTVNRLIELGAKPVYKKLKKGKAKCPTAAKRTAPKNKSKQSKRSRSKSAKS